MALGSVREAVEASVKITALVFIGCFGCGTVTIHISYPVYMLFTTVSCMLNKVASLSFRDLHGVVTFLFSF